MFISMSSFGTLDEVNALSYVMSLYLSLVKKRLTFHEQLERIFTDENDVYFQKIWINNEIGIIFSNVLLY